MQPSSSAGSRGFSRDTGSGSRLRICSRVSSVEAPANGSRPHAIWYMTTPSENRSVR
jgi:hypothetical protein